VAVTLKLAIQLIQLEVREQGRDGSLNAEDNFCSGLGWASRYSVTGYDLRMVRLDGMSDDDTVVTTRISLTSSHTSEP
jgi:hypothetical protein